MSKTFSMAMIGAFAELANATDKCYALALSSGDQNAMYQAGVISGIASTLSADEVAY